MAQISAAIDAGRILVRQQLLTYLPAFCDLETGVWVLVGAAEWATLS